MAFVAPYVPGQTPCDRPHASRVQRFKQHGVGHQTRDAPVSVRKRVYPEQAVMRRRCRNDCLGFAELGIGLFELPQKTGQGAGADRDMLTNLHISPAQSAKDHFLPRVRFRIADPEQLFR